MPLDGELRTELLDMAREDQVARDVFGHGGGLARASVADLDRRHTTRMREIVDEHGRPGRSLVGADGVRAAWLLVQHADLAPAFQRRCLELLAAAVEAGDADPVDLAYLTDRVLVADGKRQRYGTQFTENGEGGVEPFPIEDPEGVDALRASVGLGALADYRRTMEDTLQVVRGGGREPRREHASGRRDASSGP